MIAEQNRLIGQQQLKTGNASPPASASRLDHIDGLRAMACLAVFLHHCWMSSGEPQWRLMGGRVNILRLCQFGNTGVHLFLLLSGFCLFYTFARPGGLEKLDLKKFAQKRAWRILPAYYATCLLCLVLPFVLNSTFTKAETSAIQTHVPGAASLLLHATLLHGFYAPALYDLNGSFWSLSLEWQFYFTFPFLVWLFHKKGAAATVLAVGAVNLIYRILVFRYFLTKDTTFNWTICSLFMGRWLEFTLGMLAAWQLARATPLRRPARRPVSLFCLFIGAALVSGVAGSQMPAFSPLNDILWGICYFFILKAALLTSSPLKRLLCISPLVHLGAISYSVYLLHIPALQIVGRLSMVLTGHNPGMMLYVGAGGLLTLAAALPMYRLFERPFMGKVKTGKIQTDIAVVKDRYVDVI
jgi:peptidoglycan/LPS O-acetylase OafA/YrhL